jgi:hypothetical protein
MKYLFIVEKCAMTVCVVIECRVHVYCVPALQAWVREVKVKKIRNKIAIKKEFLLILILFFFEKTLSNKFFFSLWLSWTFFVLALSLTWHIHCCRIENLNAKILFMLVSCFFRKKKLFCYFLAFCRVFVWFFRFNFLKWAQMLSNSPISMSKSLLTFSHFNST